MCSWGEASEGRRSPPRSLDMRARRSVTVVLTLMAFALAVAAEVSSPPPARPQSADVLLNVFATGAGKINIAIPDFAVVSGTDAQGFAKRLPEVVGRDLSFSALFN